MAGMLPGVECARRRRLRGNRSWSDSQESAAQSSTRRSVLCLYTSNHESLLPSISSLQRSFSDESHEDEKLDGIAREAKKRLDERFRRSEATTRETVAGKLRSAKLSCKAAVQDKCPQCW